MKRKVTKTEYKGLAFAAYAFALVTMAVGINACRKSATQSKPTAPVAAIAPATSANGSILSSIYNVAAVHVADNGQSARVALLQNEEMFTVTDPSIISALQTALNNNTPVKVTYNPWGGVIEQVAQANSTERAAVAPRGIVSGGTAYPIDMQKTDADKVNRAFAVINTTGPDSLTTVIPDLITAQAMFDYIAHQCCALNGPYAVDYCITFQYCEDGCYARAHKMCWILNNRYHYATQKVFSFANDAAGVDELCVKAEKWGGCCINWWYHVAPLVTIKTPTGLKAYVFDPAMFDQPVLLSEWLHAQQNPACVPGGDVPKVTMINVQPTSSYWPASGSGYTFDTDPLYASTDTTLVHYRDLISCP